MDNSRDLDSLMTKYVQYSEDGEKWSFGGAAPFKLKRFIVIERDDKGKQVSRTVTKPEKIEVPGRDPAAK